MTGERPGMDQERLTRYLLGELAGDEQSAIEAALFEDDAAWDTVRQVEDELIDAYVVGRIDRERRARLAARIAASPRLQERVAFSRSLHALAGARPAPADLPWTARVRAWLGARPGRLVLVGVAVAALVVAVSWPGGGDPAPAPMVAALVLEPTTRAPSVPAVTIDAAAAVEVTAVLDPEDVFPRYRLRILGADGSVWSTDAAVGTRSAVRVLVPTRALAPGAYELELTGVDAGGAPVPLGRRNFRVTGADR